MDSLLSKLHSYVHQDVFLGLSHNNVLIIILFLGLITSLLCLKFDWKKFIYIHIYKRLMGPKQLASNKGPFASYYRNILCNMHEINNKQLATILQNNYPSTFSRDHSISYIRSHCPRSPLPADEGYATIDEFRAKVPLTTYDDYRNYIDRMVEDGEKNLLSTDKIVYFNTSSGTTGKIKLIPMTMTMLKETMNAFSIGLSCMWRSLPSSSFPYAKQRYFQLSSGRRESMYEKTKSGIPLGPFSQCFSAISTFSKYKPITAVANVIGLDLVEAITDFETNIFVQLVFAMTVSDIYSYSVTFPPAFIHTIKMIEDYYEEINRCITSIDFNDSSFVRNHIHDAKLVTDLNQALNEIIIEYGGRKYQMKRTYHIQQECCRKDVPGLLHRLWPSLLCASTAIGSNYSMYKEQIQFYCGDKLLLSNFTCYLASEGCFGFTASNHTDEYFLLPTYAFFEFIKEEDIPKEQPKTLLMSEIEPGNRYEMVCTTPAGLVRYRMGDVINCTRFLSHSNDLVTLPAEPKEIPRIPLISIACRIGCLDIYGEKTSERHVLNAIMKVIQQWKEQGFHVSLHDFTSYTKIDGLSVCYVVFIELIDEKSHDTNCTVVDNQFKMLQDIASNEIDRQLCIENQVYESYRQIGKLGPLMCILVQYGTFSTFLNKELVTDQVSPVQIKPRRFLRNEQHIRFFYEHQIIDCTV
ncbi:unnamed protein product [Adineta ricciae]|uniref:Uncharacterized protein n=1 Tax=Adineta ricciae TaxID=249248 RepID=A0A814HJT0_ADIRI|nr:unnamed protein product [Adineta ricciae]CAF1010612.1 unnamed protein product [Adineta ricciae]